MRLSTMARFLSAFGVSNCWPSQYLRFSSHCFSQSCFLGLSFQSFSHLSVSLMMSSSFIDKSSSLSFSDTTPCLFSSTLLVGRLLMSAPNDSYPRSEEHTSEL